MERDCGNFLFCVLKDSFQVPFSIFVHLQSYNMCDMNNQNIVHLCAITLTGVLWDGRGVIAGSLDTVKKLKSLVRNFAAI